MPKAIAPELRDTPVPRHKEAATVSPNQARAAVKTGPMRYVLGVSTVLAIVALVIAYFLVVPR